MSTCIGSYSMRQRTVHESGCRRFADVHGRLGVKDLSQRQQTLVAHRFARRSWPSPSHRPPVCPAGPYTLTGPREMSNTD